LALGRNAMEKVGRNDPCPCGSGEKYKKCHGAPAADAGWLPVGCREKMTA